MSLKFKYISPLSFYQVNSPQAEALYALALDYAGLSGGETVWDLYCGIGAISLFLASLAGRVIGIEENPAAIRDAQENARINGITNASFYAGKAEELLRKLPGEEGGSEAYPSPDVVVLDPPRAGLREEVISAVASAAPKRVVYISCNPATLARDLKLFRLRGYQPSRIRGVDMFPQTEHLESCVLLERVSNRKADSYVKLNVKMEDYYRIKDSKGGEADG